MKQVKKSRENKNGVLLKTLNEIFKNISSTDPLLQY